MLVSFKSPARADDIAPAMAVEILLPGLGCPGKIFWLANPRRLATLSTLHGDTVAPPFNADRVGEPCWQQAHVDWHVPVFYSSQEDSAEQRNLQ